MHTVGRTLVNFQRLEHNLKALSRLGPVAGTLAGIEKDLAARRERASRYTLGQAIGAWSQVLESSPTPPTRMPDLFDVTIDYSIDFGIASDVMEAHAEALTALLEERNHLVHGALATFDWDSREACAQLIAHLHEVNDAIREQMNFIATLADALRRVDPARFTVSPGEEPGSFILTSGGRD
jgi:hypothetical protein